MVSTHVYPVCAGLLCSAALTSGECGNLLPHLWSRIVDALGGWAIGAL
jgi:hypothetical protein